MKIDQRTWLVEVAGRWGLESWYWADEAGEPSALAWTLRGHRLVIHRVKAASAALTIYGFPAAPERSTILIERPSGSAALSWDPIAKAWWVGFNPGAYDLTTRDAAERLAIDLFEKLRPWPEPETRREWLLANVDWPWDQLEWNDQFEGGDEGPELIVWKFRDRTVRLDASYSGHTYQLAVYGRDLRPTVIDARINAPLPDPASWSWDDRESCWSCGISVYNNRKNLRDMAERHLIDFFEQIRLRGGYA